MDIPAVLDALQGYLRQLSSLNQEDTVEFRPTLIQELEVAADAAKKESDGKLPPFRKWGDVADNCAAVEEKIKDLSSNIASQFNDLQQIPYRLQSVFVHRGFHNSGHYWIYIYDFVKKMWRKYNDGYVTEVTDTNEIFVQEPGDRPATPYFLVYVKDQAKELLVDSVCRKPVEPPPPPEQDTIMEDYSQILELPATEANAYAPVNNSQEYGITDSYQDETYNRDAVTWDNSSTKAPITGWWSLTWRCYRSMTCGEKASAITLLSEGSISIREQPSNWVTKKQSVPDPYNVEHSLVGDTGTVVDPWVHWGWGWIINTGKDWKEVLCHNILWECIEEMVWPGFMFPTFWLNGITGMAWLGIERLKKNTLHSMGAWGIVLHCTF